MTASQRLAGSVAVGAVLAACGAAAAQTPTQGEIDRLQQQIQQMQRQLQSLQDQVNAQAAKPPPVAAVPAPGPHVAQSAATRFTLESADGQYSIGLTGRLHLDMGDYIDYHPDSKTLGTHDLNSGINARRARLGVVGKFAGDWNYTFIYDLGGSSDGFDVSVPSGGSGLGVSGGFLAGIENAYVTYNGLNRGPVPLAFDLGYQDLPITLDEATSSNDIMFMERSSSNVIATSINTGDNRAAVGIRSYDGRYWAGLYATGPVAGSAHNVGEPFGAAGRVTYQVLQAPDYSFHLGVDASALIKPATVTASAIGTTAPVTSALRTLTLSDRPELRIDPTSILSAAFGSAANPVDNAAVFGVETAAGWNSLFVQGEGFNYQVSRQGLPINNFWGGYLEGSWTPTGEHRTYIPATGAYSAIIPARPISLSAGNWGAFELAARYSYVNLDDNFNTGPAGTSNGIAGGRQQVYALGVNWYLNPNMRFMLDYLHGVIDKPSAAGETGGKFDALAVRTQVNF